MMEKQETGEEQIQTLLPGEVRAYIFFSNSKRLCCSICLSLFDNF